MDVCVWLMVFYLEDVCEFCLDVTLHQSYSAILSRAQFDHQVSSAPEVKLILKVENLPLGLKPKMLNRDSLLWFACYSKQ